MRGCDGGKQVGRESGNATLARQMVAYTANLADSGVVFHAIVRTPVSGDTPGATSHLPPVERCHQVQPRPSPPPRLPPPPPPQPSLSRYASHRYAEEATRPAVARQPSWTAHSPLPRAYRR